MMKTISIVTACYNEEANVELLVARVREIMASLPQYRYDALVAVQNGWARVLAEGVQERFVRQLATVAQPQTPANNLPGFEVHDNG